MKLTSIMETVPHHYDKPDEIKVREQMEKELQQRLKYAMKFGDEFDPDGAIKDLLNIYDRHAEFFKHRGGDNLKTYYKDKHFKVVWDVMYKRFGEEAADVIAQLLMK